MELKNLQKHVRTLATLPESEAPARRRGLERAPNAGPASYKTSNQRDHGRARCGQRNACVAQPKTEQSQVSETVSQKDH
jgi:hypothetical protein